MGEVYELRVAAAAILEERRLLLVSKRSAPDVFYLPGGKPDPGESALDCVRREVREELCAGLVSVEPFAVVSAPAALEGVPMEMTVYLAALDGPPEAAAEIAELRWLADGEPFAGRLAPAVADAVLPELRARRLL
jgi:8-oxo-dGTP diphosphatase